MFRNPVPCLTPRMVGEAVQINPILADRRPSAAGVATPEAMAVAGVRACRAHVGGPAAAEEEAGVVVVFMVVEAFAASR
jgi:hypothetical protein